MSNNNTQPVEVQARESIAVRAASCLVWEKQNAANTSAVRKSSFGYMMEAARAAGKLTDEEISNVCSSFAVKLVEGGIKKDTVKVRKSELRRILEHIILCRRMRPDGTAPSRVSRMQQWILSNWRAMT